MCIRDRSQAVTLSKPLDAMGQARQQRSFRTIPAVGICACEQQHALWKGCLCFFFIGCTRAARMWMCTGVSGWCHAGVHLVEWVAKCACRAGNQVEGPCGWGPEEARARREAPPVGSHDQDRPALLSEPRRGRRRPPGAAAPRREGLGRRRRRRRRRRVARERARDRGERRGIVDRRRFRRRGPPCQEGARLSRCDAAAAECSIPEEAAAVYHLQGHVHVGSLLPDVRDTARRRRSADAAS